jgi:hypothetical protein
MTYHHLGRDEEARRVEEKLRGFEPKFAATLKRDIEQTPSAAATASRTPDHLAHKEAIATPV